MKTYSRAISFLDSLLNLEQTGKLHSRVWNLKRMRKLLEIFNHPERGIFTVLVAGTKGKGSTAYFLSEILRHSGLRIGFYQSPHLESPTERIWINGKPVTKEKFAKGLLKIRSVIARQRYKYGRSNLDSRLLCRPTKGGTPRHDERSLLFTYFEIMTLLAVLLFKESNVDAAIYEVGMGGRLDATNALPAKLVLLTPIHYDHEAYLGNTLDKIAREKAAVLRRGRNTVCAPQPKEARREIERIARKRKSRIWSPLRIKGMKLQLLGDFQELNAQMALRASDILRKRYHFPVTRRAMLKGVGSNHWPGRMELIRVGAPLVGAPRGRGQTPPPPPPGTAQPPPRGRGQTPPLLIDGAHNPKSTEALARNINKLFPHTRKILIFGTSRDKRSDRMLPALAKAFDVCILTQSKSPRAKETAALLNEAQHHFRTLLPAASAREALRLAKRLAAPQDLIVGTGSFYLIGELRSLCRN